MTRMCQYLHPLLLLFQSLVLLLHEDQFRAHVVAVVTRVLLASLDESGRRGLKLLHLS